MAGSSKNDDETPTIPGAFFDLVLALRAASRDAETGSALYGREDKMTEDDWKRIDRSMGLVMTKYAALQALRDEAAKREDIEQIVGYLDGGFAR